MEKISIVQIKKHLNEIISMKTDTEIFEAIRVFQGWMWDGKYDLSSSAAEILGDLAMDLEYFNPNETGSEFYGRPKLYKEIQAAVTKI